MKNYCRKKETVDGYTHYYNETNQLHRTDGPAIEYKGGNKEYFLNGKRHRENGPAIEWGDGSKEYWINGKRHRIDGFAIEYKSFKSYWINDKKYLKQEFEEIKNFPMLW